LPHLKNSIFTATAKIAHTGIKRQGYINPDDRIGALDISYDEIMPKS